MTVVARDLSNACGFTVSADPIRVGGGCTSLGVVSMGTSTRPDIRIHEDDKKLKKLEQKLMELKHGPLHIHLLPTPEDFSGDEISQVVKYWRKEHKRRRQGKRKVHQREKDNAETREVDGVLSRLELDDKNDERT